VLVALFLVWESVLPSPAGAQSGWPSGRTFSELPLSARQLSARRVLAQRPEQALLL
jgi:hypothetical protein